MSAKSNGLVLEQALFLADGDQLQGVHHAAALVVTELDVLTVGRNLGSKFARHEVAVPPLDEVLVFAVFCKTNASVIVINRRVHNHNSGDIDEFIIQIVAGQGSLHIAVIDVHIGNDLAGVGIRDYSIFIQLLNAVAVGVTVQLFCLLNSDLLKKNLVVHFSD